jgi:nucleoid-associated protein YejK
MSDFKVEQNTTSLAAKNANVKRTELIKQIESLQRFYYDMGYDTANLKTIFSLTLSYLRGQVNKLVVKSFFDVLMAQDKLSLNKEINLLNCFDDLIDELEFSDSNKPSCPFTRKSSTKPTNKQLNLGVQDAA